MLQLERVPICNCIYVKGLMYEETLQLTTITRFYFENEKRSGGGNVSTVERIGKDEVLVHFEDPSSKKCVLLSNFFIRESIRNFNIPSTGTPPPPSHPPSV